MSDSPAAPPLGTTTTTPDAVLTALGDPTPTPTTPSSPLLPASCSSQPAAHRRTQHLMKRKAVSLWRSRAQRNAERLKKSTSVLKATHTELSALRAEHAALLGQLKRNNVLSSGCSESDGLTCSASVQSDISKHRPTTCASFDTLPRGDTFSLDDEETRRPTGLLSRRGRGRVVTVDTTDLERAVDVVTPARGVLDSYLPKGHFHIRSEDETRYALWFEYERHSRHIAKNPHLEGLFPPPPHPNGEALVDNSSFISATNEFDVTTAEVPFEYTSEDEAMLGWC